MAQIIINADVGTFGDDVLRGRIQTDNHGGTTILHSPDDFIYDYIYNYGDTIYGKSGSDTIIGDRYDTVSQDRGYDYLYGEDGNDVIYGDTGREDPNWNTEVFTGSGNVLVGGLGGDVVYGGGGSNGDYIYGDMENTGTGTLDDGHDRLYGLGGNDYIYGGGGNDYIDGGVDNDGNLRGGIGNDTIRGGLGNDNQYGGAGSDLFYADDGDDYIDGDGEVSHNTEIDTLSYIGMAFYVTVDLSITSGQATNAGGFDSIRNIEKLVGSNYADRLYGSDMGEQIYGMNGLDDIRGGQGNDSLSGGAGKDTVGGGTGNDKAYGGDGNDGVYGEDGADRLYGDAGNDLVDGGVENDILYGGTGNDVLKGGVSGADTIYGGLGDDRIYGGQGRDLMIGDAGKDSFYFYSPLVTGNQDKITGFRPVDDTIMLAKSVFAALGASIVADEFRIGSGAADGQDHIIYNSATGVLSYDSNGSALGGSHAIVTLDKGLALTYHDFLLY